ncbi:MAG TPA: exodeoxyribonuclease VII small subunit [Candidatus Aminicenantes bacterium]|nr:MAG: exodeoxyribonuclease VII small subunit [Candidatus Aminicenantes bacterium]HEK86615.1 exodeoxyribonuclease VII small subunit [Candidatus Aminicenantes bacterium]
MNFEKALAELEQIVTQLEKGGLALNESLALFEKGVRLARYLRAELDKAEKKVEILLKDEKGELKAQDFNPEEISSSSLEEAGEEPEEEK